MDSESRWAIGFELDWIWISFHIFIILAKFALGIFAFFDIMPFISHTHALIELKLELAYHRLKELMNFRVRCFSVYSYLCDIYIYWLPWIFILLEWLLCSELHRYIGFTWFFILVSAYVIITIYWNEVNV